MFQNVENVPNIGIIGAGPAGLISAKHAISHGYGVTIYEKSEDIGGTWLYTKNMGTNKYGASIHTALYEGLRYTVVDIFVIVVLFFTLVFTILFRLKRLISLTCVVSMVFSF